MRKMILGLAILFCLFLSRVSYPGAAHAFLLGAETRGATIKINEESDLTFRLLLQPRLDTGEIIQNSSVTAYTTGSDLYMRRVRLEAAGHIVKDLKFNITLAADKWDRIGNKNEVTLHYAYLNYQFAPAFHIEYGKHKLPYSRVAMVSDTAQLLIEGPASTEAAKKLFGETDAYYQPVLKFGGSSGAGVFNYAIAVGDGWRNGENIHAGKTVEKAGTLLTGRLELSPPGWTEDKKSDAHLGKGRHATAGVNYAVQDSIKYKENGYGEKRELFGFDLSGHYESLEAQFGYNGWKEAYGDPALSDKAPEGWYAQAGWFFPSYSVEPAVRYEVYDQDSNAKDKKERSRTVGLNWYLKGHSAKLSANWVHTGYEKKAKGWFAADKDRDMVQVQGQIYF
ncbi:MAG: hypothetical protein HY890_08155 [Deltaproteobacteria bacterium]|nr:hypothetical protein [Deltaproteobacteria bacterium]